MKIKFKEYKKYCYLVLLFFISGFSTQLVALISPDALSPYGLGQQHSFSPSEGFFKPSTERTEEDLIGKGYSLIYKHPCVNFRGCYHNYAYSLGQYKFVCDENRFQVRHSCVDVLIYGKNHYHKNLDLTTSYHYACIKNYYCYRGKLEPW